MPTSVCHNIARSRFELAGGGGMAVCEYAERDGVWHFTHTFVPDELRGRGMAALLVGFALETARKEGKKIVPVCEYVAAFLERHPEFQDLKHSG